MKSLPRWSVENPVLINMLMMALLIGGAFSALALVRELVPEWRPDKVMIVTPYPGASPLEVEKGITLKIEEAIKDQEHIEKIDSTIVEGQSMVLVSMTSDARNIDQVVNDFKAAIDAIPRDELPRDAEQTTVAKFEPTLPVISVALYGPAGEKALKELGQRMRDDLLRLPGISKVHLSGTRRGELSVEIEPELLVAYQVSLREVAGAIAESNLDLPGGQLRTEDQNVAVRTLGETDEAAVIAETIVRTTEDGQLVRVRDLGRVVDGFEDSDVRSRFNGEPAVDIVVSKTTDQDAIDIANKVRAFVSGKLNKPLELHWTDRIRTRLGWTVEETEIWQASRREPLPDNVQIETHTDLSRFIEGRLELLTRNGLWGLSFVFLALLLFLNWRIAFWVMMGLILSISGSILLMSLLGVSLNMITMFGLIIVLGLIVDDAIVVGENIYARVERGEDPKLAAVTGAEEVTWPVLVAVLTTIGAFVPLLFIEGQMGDFMGLLPIVVACALAISLIEALMILPSHLADTLKPVRRDVPAPSSHRMAQWIEPFRERQQRFVREVLVRFYERLLRTLVAHRYVTIAVMVGIMIVWGGVVGGGRLPFVFMQDMDSEMLSARLEMPVGTPADQTEEVIRQVEEAVLALDESELSSVFTIVGVDLQFGEEGASGTVRSHKAQVLIELTTVEKRERRSDAIIADLRAATADIAGIESLTFQPLQGGPGGMPIEIEVTGDRVNDLLAASEVLRDRLGQFAGVFDLRDDFERGRREMQIELLEAARPLRFTTQTVATEIRGAFYGLEARKIQREREDIDIRVRFPLDRRRNVSEIEAMWLAAPGGGMVPLTEIARLQEGRGYASLRRIDQRRAIVVSADVDQAIGNAQQIIASLQPTVDELEARYPGVRIHFAGTFRETARAFGSLRRDFTIAVLAIFVMLAGLFKSYVQPLIVMLAIPFGLNGALVGHVVMGYPLTLLSLIGMVALTGIVVNDALILITFVNNRRLEGMSALEAVILGGKRRFRPILLTSLTTILGLAPMMAETSFQAAYLIPMAISISFGLAFATVLTLLIVPCLYMFVEDVRKALHWIWVGHAEPAAPGANAQAPA